MRHLSLILLLGMLSGLATGQETKSITVNTLNPEDEKQLTRSAYHFPKFADGKVVFKDSLVIEAKMNYHRVFGQILFISPKGDTLALSNPETFLHVIIQQDTFYAYDKGFLRKITHYKGNNLVIKQTVSFVGREKPGPYGSYTPLSATNSNNTVTTDNQITNYIGIDENHIYKYTNHFFLSDAYNNFFRATKKNFYNMFTSHEKEIKKYLDVNKTDFNKQADLEKLLDYIHSL